MNVICTVPEWFVCTSVLLSYDTEVVSMCELNAVVGKWRSLEQQ